MRCLRCQGLMIAITLMDMDISTSRLASWRCLLCGEVRDPAIEANRRSRRTLKRSKARPPGSPLARASEARRRK